MEPVSGSPGIALTRRWWLPAVLGLLLAVAGCAGNGGARGGPFPRFAEYEGREVRRVSFVGDLELPVDSLRLVIATRPSRCRILFLPLCIPGTSIGRDVYRLDLQDLASDITRLHLYYRDHGYYGSRIVPSVDPIDEDKVAVRFAIAPGDQVVLRELTLTGTEGIAPPEELLERMPLEVGEPFGRLAFLASADTVRAELLRRGHAYAEVLRNYGIDTIADVAETHLVALPGPVVHVDTVLFLGSERISERTLRKQMTFGEGDVLRLPELGRSQRNIYALEMVSFASIELAPDSLQVNPDSTQATVVVRLVEAAQYLVDASAGFGTIDCFRTGGRWVNRNFVGGGRRLEVTGSLSRIGAGAPLDAGLDQSVCARSREEAFGERVNYRLGANFLQPRLFNTQNQLSVGVHSERFSELDVFLRESTGAQVTLARDIGQQTLLTTTADFENGRTLATPVILCVGFETCTEEDLQLLEEPRWSNLLSLSLARDRTRTDQLITRGYLLRGGIDWSSQVIGSDNEFLRVGAEGSVYRPLRPGWVLGGNLRVGRFVSGSLRTEDGYTPPELRFYAGGPNSVRGYGRNALGPTAYVSRPERPDAPEQDTVSTATGGTQLLVASVEVRGPSPFLSDLVRLAAFVDAGHVSAPGTGLGTSGLRMTPGVGLRFLTPVGPIRLDVAYNGYPPERGPLYRVGDDGSIERIEDEFRPESLPQWSWERFRIHFAVGQAF